MLGGDVGQASLSLNILQTLSSIVLFIQ